MDLYLKGRRDERRERREGREGGKEGGRKGGREGVRGVREGGRGVRGVREEGRKREGEGSTVDGTWYWSKYVLCIGQHTLYTHVINISAFFFL